MESSSTSESTSESAPLAATDRGRRRPSQWLPLLAALALLVLAFRAGLRLDAPRARPVASPAGSVDGVDPALADLGRSLARLRVRTAAGDVVAAAPPGEPAVVMVSSVTCGYCEQSLRDLAAMAEGRPLPRLRVVTLEGAAPGAAMLQRFGVRGALSAGPLGSAEQVLLTFRIPGTPVFAAIDSTGRLTSVVPGYPGRKGLASLYRVMVAE